MTSWMQGAKRRLVSALAVGAFVWGSVVLASAARAQDAPFKGVVVQANVKVLAGAGRQYYKVGTLKKDTVVEVHQVLYGWNVIVPPKGFYSYISQAYVDAKGKGGVGVVNGDNAKVTAGNVKGPGLSYREQLTLDKGAKVTILGEDGSYYKIAPPQGAYVFLPPGSVRRASLEEKNAAGGRSMPTSNPTPTPEKKQPSNQGAGQGASSGQTPEAAHQTGAGTNLSPKQAGAKKDKASGSETGHDLMKELHQMQAAADGGAAGGVAAKKGHESAQATEPVATQPSASSFRAAEAAHVVKVETPAVSPALRKVEMAELPLFSKPIAKQPLAKMKAAYETVSQDASLPAFDREIVRMRLAMIARNQRIAKTLESINAVQASVDASEKAEAQAAKKAAEHPQPVNYDLVGRLEASSVYDGSSLPRLYRIVDHNDNTLAYVRPGAVDARKMLGQIVGVIGERAYNSALRLNIFQIKRIDVLSPSAAK